MDDWWDRLYREPVSGLESRRGDQATTEEGREAEKSPALASASTASKGMRASSPRIPFSVSGWGSGRDLDPFLRENSAHPELVEEGPPKKEDNTPEETEELRKHEEGLGRKEGEDLLTRKGEEEPKPPLEEEKIESPKERGEKNWKDRIRGAKKKTQEKVHEGKSKVSSLTAPARKGAASALNATAPANGKTFSFFWSFIAAWVLSFQMFAALLDRLALVFGSPSPLFGEERTEWVWFRGAGPWFGDQVESHMEAGTVNRLILLFLIGLIPVLIAQFSEKIPESRARKFLVWLGYGFLVFFICSISYITAMGFHSWNELYISLLSALSWWGFSFSRTVQPGFYQCALRVPLAAVVVGVGLNAPGAAF